MRSSPIGLLLLVGCVEPEPATVPSPPRGSAQLHIDAEALYWVDRSLGSLQRHDRASGATTSIAAVSSTGTWDLAGDASTLYWDDSLDGPGIRSVRLSDGQTRTLGPSLDATGAIAAGEEFLYLGAQVGERFELAVLGLDGASPAPLFDDDYAPLALELADDGRVYGTSCWNGGIWRVPAEGGERETIVPQTFCPSSIAVDGDFVYFVDGAAETRLYRIVRDGGARGNALLIDTIEGDAFAVRDAEVFLPREGSMFQLGAEDVELGPASSVVGVAADEGILYWLERSAADGPTELHQVAIED